MLIDFDSSTLIICALVASGLLFVANRRRPSPWPRRICLGLFSLYLIAVAKYVFFPIPIGGGMRETFRQQSTFLDQVDPVPFGFGSGAYLTSIQAYGNVLLALPFGFALPFLWQTNWKRVLYWAGGFGLAIEAIQLLISLALGFSYRTIDINDSLFNFAGVVLGYLAFLGFARAFLRFGIKAHFAEKGIGGYLLNRCRR